MFNSLTPLTFPFFHCVFHECPYPQNYQGLFLYLMFPHTLIKTGLEMGVVFGCSSTPTLENGGTVPKD